MPRSIFRSRSPTASRWHFSSKELDSRNDDNLNRRSCFYPSYIIDFMKTRYRSSDYFGQQCAPAVFRNIIILRAWIQFGDHLRAPIAAGNVHLPLFYYPVRPWPEPHVGVGLEQGGGGAVRAVVSLGKEDRHSGLAARFHQTYCIIDPRLHPRLGRRFGRMGVAVQDVKKKQGGF